MHSTTTTTTTTSSSSSTTTSQLGETNLFTIARIQPITKLPVAPPPPQPPSSSSSAASFNTIVYSKDDFPNEKLFQETIHYPAISVPVLWTATCRQKLKNELVKGIKNVYVDVHRSDCRILVLQQPSTKDVMQKCTWRLDNEIRKDDMIPNMQWIDAFPLTRTYHDQSVEEILRKLLPMEDIPTGFELVGSIAHLNLNEMCWPYKYWIGKVLLDRSAAVKTVVNKIGTIDNVYRTFDMEILAGDESENWSIVKVQEHGSTFELDYKHVYWNSRLSQEHKRLVDLIFDRQEREGRPMVVVDLMAGVGPFAVPLTSRKQQQCISHRYEPIVYANDLNPISFQYLQKNAKLNKCSNLQCYNLDARRFWHQLLTQCSVGTTPSSIDHVIMNLPGSAPEFLDLFRGWTLPQQHPVDRPTFTIFPTTTTTCMIHVYCFAPKKSIDFQETIARCEQALGCPISQGSSTSSTSTPTLSVHIVRNVSPSNNMVCVTFPLPTQVAQLPRICMEDKKEDDDGADPSNDPGPDTKRIKLNASN